jgi:hypothetical protein
MTKTTLILGIFLVVGLCGCKQTSNDERAQALLREANNLLKQDTQLSEKWTRDYQTAFRPQERAKFPSNRDWMREHAARIIPILDESSGLCRQMADKYEEASKLSSKDNERKGVAAVAASIRNNVETNELFKSQMLLVSDEQIKDEKTFNEKFMQLAQQLEQKRRENDELFQQGKRLLGGK